MSRDDWRGTAPAENPTAWADRIRAQVGATRTMCPCGQPATPGRARCPACAAADALATSCQRCGQAREPGQRICHGCAEAGAKVIREAVASGRIRPSMLTGQPAELGPNLRAVRDAHGLTPAPAKGPTRAQRRAERDAREADARARMRAAGLPLGRGESQ